MIDPLHTSSQQDESLRDEVRFRLEIDAGSQAHAKEFSSIRGLAVITPD